ncbi:glycogen debranching protein GlgX [Stutzerimonas stutzeri TS44]|nr:glycogen debranching protein GlgX [Stutzerimonas stutzeri TS44]
MHPGDRLRRRRQPAAPGRRHPRRQGRCGTRREHLPLRRVQHPGSQGLPGRARHRDALRLRLRLELGLAEQPAQRRLQVGRQHHHLGIAAAGKILQRGDVLFAEQIHHRSAVAADGLGNQPDRRGRGGGQFHLRRGVALGRLQARLGLEDRRLLGAFGTGHGGLALALGGRLHLHRALHGLGRRDVLNLDALDRQPPVAGLLGHAVAQLGLDDVARGQRLVQLHLADDLAQGGLGQVGDRRLVVGDAVHRLHRIGDLHEAQRVGEDHRVVLGDHLLLLDVEDLVLGHQLVGDVVHVRDQDVEAGNQRALITAQALDDPFVALRNQAYALGDGGEDEYHNDDRNDQTGCHKQLPC